MLVQTAEDQPETLCQQYAKYRLYEEASKETGTRSQNLLRRRVVNGGLRHHKKEVFCMVKIEVTDRGRIELLQATGNCMEVAAQICAAVGDLYRRLRNTHEESGELFRDTIMALLKDDGAAWNVETRKEPERGYVIVTPSEEEAA